MTHRGLVRERNEDSILTDPTGRLWAVADGMGGHGYGDVASDIAIDCIAVVTDHDDPYEILRERLVAANQAVRARAAAGGLGQIGATIVVALVDHARAHIAWAGDSRAYLLRAGRLRLLTRDHTVVQDLVDRGELSADLAETHPESHIVTRAIGGAPEIEVDQIELPLVPGDRLMLCSDGLPRCVYEHTIEAILGKSATPHEICEDLLREALAQGAPDNVSAIVVDISGEGS
jgi:protein phosphatase